MRRGRHRLVVALAAREVKYFYISPPALIPPYLGPNGVLKRPKLFILTTERGSTDMVTP